jgi:hypothetical protein
LDLGTAFAGIFLIHAIKYIYPAEFSGPSRGTEIFIFSVPYFLATKLVAYCDRGKSDDPRVSQDLEDICSVLDGCTTVQKDVADAPASVRKFVQNELLALLKDEALFEETAHGFIRQSGDPVGRAKRIVKVARAITFP